MIEGYFLKKGTNKLDNLEKRLNISPIPRKKSKKVVVLAILGSFDVPLVIIVIVFLIF
jgi:hypothetical protein